MALLKKKTPEELAADKAAKERRRLELEERKSVQQAAKERETFERSPVGRARAGFDRGDHVFQYSLGVMNQKGIITAIIDRAMGQSESDPVVVLNSVCREGWELVNGSFVFVEQGQQARDTSMASGQNVAVEGEVVGYYLFKRSEANRRTHPAG
ncbi:hypothetical protein ABZ342_41615 [Amycolatopsis sp. NPDC005961]|uniref:hypothetical protein n=1 Tax=Amycolatopsis sp. NPDC005961 TaxID=3156720 RepID=UPI0033EFCA6A